MMSVCAKLENVSQIRSLIREKNKMRLTGLFHITTVLQLHSVTATSPHRHINWINYCWTVMAISDVLLNFPNPRNVFPLVFLLYLCIIYLAFLASQLTTNFQKIEILLRDGERLEEMIFVVIILLMSWEAAGGNWCYNYVWVLSLLSLSLSLTDNKHNYNQAATMQTTSFSSLLVFSNTLSLSLSTVLSKKAIITFLI